MKGPSTPRLPGTLCTVCVLGVFAPAATLAQSAPSDAVSQLDTIIVTGTHAKDRTEINSTSPVDVLGAEDLRAVAGPEASLGQALQALLPSFNYLDQSNSGSADHVRAGQLRGLNPDQVLVLINGRRVHPTSIVNVESVVGLGAVAVDFNSIPVNAIKRVEVLRDGAGAQYGSDAIAGVINVILDSAPSGGELAINAGEFHTHFAPTNRSITDGQTVNAQGKYGIALGGTGSLRFGIDATSHQPTNRAGFDQLYPDPNANSNPGSTTRTFSVGDAQIRNINLWLNSELPLSGGATAYGTAIYDHRTSTGDAFFREPLDGYANLPAVYPNGYLPQSTGMNDDWHLCAGAKGPLAGQWRFDAALTYGLNKFTYGLANSLNASFGPSSPTAFNLGKFRFSQTTANIDLSRDVDLGLASTAVLATGAELRRETYATTAGDYASYATGSYISPAIGGTPNGGSEGDGGIKPGDVADTGRNIAGVYVDLSGNLLPSLFADASARFDHYTDAGSSTTGKLSARWEFVPRYALRGAISNNFRAPALAQISSAYSPTSYTTSNNQLGGIQIVPVSDPIARSLGAQPLRPERSHNYSLGLTAQPVAQLQLSVDLFKIDINDRISLSQPLSPASGQALYEFFTNAVDTETRGAEFVGSWTTRLAGGTVRLSDASMWANNSVRDVRKQPAIDPGALGLTFGLQAQNAITTAIPKRRDVVSATYSGDGSAGSWNLLTRVTHTGEVTRVFDFSAFGGGVPTQTYGATVQLDLEAEYKATRDLALALGAINLTDRYPAQSSSDINYYGNLPYDFLAPIGFNGRYVYLRLRYELR